MTTTWDNKLYVEMAEPLDVRSHNSHTIPYSALTCDNPKLFPWIGSGSNGRKQKGNFPLASIAFGQIGYPANFWLSVIAHD
jgi:hypothetical protein